MYANSFHNENWEFLRVTIHKTTQFGFGIAISGGLDNPHFADGDISLTISDVLVDGPACGRLKINDRIESVGGVILKPMKYVDALKLLKDAGNILNLIVKRRIHSGISKALVFDTVTNPNVPHSESVFAVHIENKMHSHPIKQASDHIVTNLLYPINNANIMKEDDTNQIKRISLDGNVYIKDVSLNHLEPYLNLHSGDIILQINKIPIEQLSLVRAQDMINNMARVELLIHRGSRLDQKSAINGRRRYDRLTRSYNTFPSRLHSVTSSPSSSHNKTSRGDVRYSPGLRDEGEPIGIPTSHTDDVDVPEQNDVTSGLSARAAALEPTNGPSLFVLPQLSSPVSWNLALNDKPDIPSHPGLNSGGEPLSEMSTAPYQLGYHIDCDIHPLHLLASPPISSIIIPNLSSGVEPCDNTLPALNGTLGANVRRINIYTTSLFSSWNAEDEESFDPKTTAQESDMPRARVTRDKGLGLRLVGGNKVGIFIATIEPGSIAHRSGLITGDKIMSINECCYSELNREEAVTHLLNELRDLNALYQSHFDRSVLVKGLNPPKPTPLSTLFRDPSLYASRENFIPIIPPTPTTNVIPLNSDTLSHIPKDDSMSGDQQTIFGLSHSSSHVTIVNEISTSPRKGSLFVDDQDKSDEICFDDVALKFCVLNAPRELERIMNSGEGDDFYVRSNFDDKTQFTKSKQYSYLETRFGDIYLVRDTLFAGQIGHWYALRMPLTPLPILSSYQCAIQASGGDRDLEKVSNHESCSFTIQEWVPDTDIMHRSTECKKGWGILLNRPAVEDKFYNYARRHTHHISKHKSSTPSTLLRKASLKLLSPFSVPERVKSSSSYRSENVALSKDSPPLSSSGLGKKLSFLFNHNHEKFMPRAPDRGKTHADAGPDDPNMMKESIGMKASLGEGSISGNQHSTLCTDKSERFDITNRILSDSYDKRRMSNLIKRSKSLGRKSDISHIHSPDRTIIYERVHLAVPNYRRPVVILGHLSKLITEELADNYPTMFHIYRKVGFDGLNKEVNQGNSSKHLIISPNHCEDQSKTVKLMEDMVRHNSLPIVIQCFCEDPSLEKKLITSKDHHHPIYVNNNCTLRPVDRDSDSNSTHSRPSDSYSNNLNQSQPKLSINFPSIINKRKSIFSSKSHRDSGNYLKRPKLKKLWRHLITGLFYIEDNCSYIAQLKTFISLLQASPIWLKYDSSSSYDRNHSSSTLPTIVPVESFMSHTKEPSMVGCSNYGSTASIHNIDHLTQHDDVPQTFPQTQDQMNVENFIVPDVSEVLTVTEKNVPNGRNCELNMQMESTTDVLISPQTSQIPTTIWSQNNLSTSDNLNILSLPTNVTDVAPSYGYDNYLDSNMMKPDVYSNDFNHPHRHIKNGIYGEGSNYIPNHRVGNIKNISSPPALSGRNSMVSDYLKLGYSHTLCDSRFSEDSIIQAGISTQTTHPPFNLMPVNQMETSHRSGTMVSLHDDTHVMPQPRDYFNNASPNYPISNYLNQIILNDRFVPLSNDQIMTGIIARSPSFSSIYVSSNYCQKYISNLNDKFDGMTTSNGVYDPLTSDVGWNTLQTRKRPTKPPPPIPPKPTKLIPKLTNNATPFTPYGVSHHPSAQLATPLFNSLESGYHSKSSHRINHTRTPLPQLGKTTLVMSTTLRNSWVPNASSTETYNVPHFGGSGVKRTNIKTSPMTNKGYMHP